MIIGTLQIKGVGCLISGKIKAISHTTTLQITTIDRCALEWRRRLL